MNYLKPRDRQILMIAPALILLMIYYFFFARPMGEEKTELKRQRTALDASSLTQQDLSGKRRQVIDLKNEVAALQKANFQNTASKQNNPASTENLQLKQEATAFFEAILKKNQIVLIDEALAEAAEQKKYSPLLINLADAELWHMRLAGTYQNMAMMVAELNTTELPVAIAGLSMDKKTELGSRISIWNLWIGK